MDYDLHGARTGMRRTAVAMAWLIGATVPLLMATVFLFGCCVLPFHGVVHRVLPLCHLAAGLLNDHQQPAPAPEKREPVKRVAIELSCDSRIAGIHETRAVTPAGSSTYRSFISHGAMRCDRDVGLHLLDATFLI